MKLALRAQAILCCEGGFLFTDCLHEEKDMNLAVKIVTHDERDRVETPESHAAEIAALQSLDATSLKRLQAIAQIYSRGVEEYDERAMPKLRYELRSALERFGLWDDLTIARAIEELVDPMGW